MNNELSKKEDLFSLTQEKLDVDTVKTLLEIFKFDIPEEQLPYIQIKNLEKWRISFINSFTKETCSAFYTSECPVYDQNCRYSGESESFLGQKIISDSVIRMNWFELQGKRYIFDPFRLEAVYVPPYNRKNVLIIEQAIFSSKNSDGDFVLHIQKDYPKSDKRTNFEVFVYKGKLEEVYERQYGDVMDADNRRQIVRMKYGLNKDYNYFETGAFTNIGSLNETREIYGRNMSALTDYLGKDNCLVDNRLVYGVDCDKKDEGIIYHGVISEDAAKPFQTICPPGMMSLALPLQAIEEVKEKLISKIYFQGRDRTSDSGTKTLGILKTNKGIKIVRDERQYDRTGDFKKMVGYQRVEKESFPLLEEGTITIEEIQKAISILCQNNPEDKFVKAVCNELEMFIERKNERKELSQMEFQVSDICNPNLAVNFDTELIVDMIIKQGIGNSISNILRVYADMFRNDKQAVINCNREINDKKIE